MKKFSALFFILAATASWGADAPSEVTLKGEEALALNRAIIVANGVRRFDTSEAGFVRSTGNVTTGLVAICISNDETNPSEATCTLTVYKDRRRN